MMFEVTKGDPWLPFSSTGRVAVGLGTCQAWVGGARDALTGSWGSLVPGKDVSCGWDEGGGICGSFVFSLGLGHVSLCHHR